MTCGWLAFVVLGALVAQFLVGAWWVDALASLGIVWFVIREGREAWEGKIAVTNTVNDVFLQLCRCKHQLQPDQAANISHKPKASPDSTSLAGTIEFATMTGIRLHLCRVMAAGVIGHGS
jgi:hypothetical protein